MLDDIICLLLDLFCLLSIVVIVILPLYYIRYSLKNNYPYVNNIISEYVHFGEEYSQRVGDNKVIKLLKILGFYYKYEDGFIESDSSRKRFWLFSGIAFKYYIIEDGVFLKMNCSFKVIFIPWHRLVLCEVKRSNSPKIIRKLFFEKELRFKLLNNNHENIYVTFYDYHKFSVNIIEKTKSN